MKRLLVMAVVAALSSGCGANTSTSMAKESPTSPAYDLSIYDAQVAEVSKQQEQVAAQIEEAERQMTRQKELVDASTELMARQRALIEKQEQQAKRYDAILEKWERQSAR